MPIRPKFGIEIECFNIPNEGVNETLDNISREGWDFKDDGSIRGENPCEIVSSPLPWNQESFTKVKNTMKIIRDAGGQVNRSCGFHVHVEVPHSWFSECDMGLFFSTLVRRYQDLEEYIDTLVPPSRRGNRNGFCRSLSSMHRDGFEDALADMDESDSFSEYFDDFDRYFKLNLAAFARHGTVEFRQFGSTLNGTKAVAWIKFCLAFVEAARRHSLLTNPQRMSLEDWRNPYYLLASQSATRYLTQRHEETVAATLAAQTASSEPANV